MSRYYPRKAVNLRCQLLAQAESGSTQQGITDPRQLTKTALEILIYAEGLDRAREILRKQWSDHEADWKAGRLNIGGGAGGMIVQK